jgi:hypothetical protein
VIESQLVIACMKYGWERLECKESVNEVWDYFDGYKRRSNLPSLTNRSGIFDACKTSYFHLEQGGCFVNTATAILVDRQFTN